VVVLVLAGLAVVLAFAAEPGFVVDLAFAAAAGLALGLVLDDVVDVVVDFAFASVMGLAPGVPHLANWPFGPRHRCVVLVLGQATNLPEASRHWAASARPAPTDIAATTAARAIVALRMGFLQQPPLRQSNR
jgi:hypothetical protein